MSATEGREPKKTETIEIRLSSDTKSALQARARAEGRSVSEVLRALIGRYLETSEQGATSNRKALLMRYAPVAAALAALISTIVLVAPARAADVVLDVDASLERAAQGQQILHPTSNPAERGTLLRQVKTSLALDVGRAVVLCIPKAATGKVRVLAGADARCALGGEGFALFLRAESVRDGAALITMAPLYDGSGPGEPSAEPIKFGQEAGMLAPAPAAGESPKTGAHDFFRLTVVAKPPPAH